MGVKPIIATVTVATAGTRVRVTTSNIYVTSVYFEALNSGNTGSIYIGDSAVSSTLYMSALTAGQGFRLTIDSNPTRPSDANGGPEINLSSLYVDGTTNGNKVQVSYITRVGSV